MKQSLTICGLAVAIFISAHASDDLGTVKTAASSKPTVTDGWPSKTFTWGKIDVNGCHETGGTLVLRADGKATFSLVTWTDSKDSAVNYWTGFMLPSGVSLTKPNPNAPEQYYYDTPMPKGSPLHRYPCHWDFAYDKTQFGSITEVIQISASKPIPYDPYADTVRDQFVGKTRQEIIARFGKPDSTATLAGKNLSRPVDEAVRAVYFSHHPDEQVMEMDYKTKKGELYFWLTENSGKWTDLSDFQVPAGVKL